MIFEFSLHVNTGGEASYTVVMYESLLLIDLKEGLRNDPHFNRSTKSRRIQLNEDT